MGIGAKTTQFDEIVIKMELSTCLLASVGSLDGRSLLPTNQMNLTDNNSFVIGIGSLRVSRPKSTLRESIIA